MTGSDSPLEGRCGAKLRNSNPPRYCGQRPIAGRTRCKLHGGKSLQSIERPNYKHGRYDGLLPTGLSKHVTAAKQGLDRVSNTDEIDLVTGKIRERFERLSAGESPEAWSRVSEIRAEQRAALDAFQVARKKLDGPGMTAAMQQLETLDAELGEIASKGVGEGKLWQGITNDLLIRKKLVDSEVRRQRVTHDTLNKSRALALMSFLVRSLVGHLDTLITKLPEAHLGAVVDVKKAIVADVRVLMAGEGDVSGQ